ncbi:MAG TPA: hypothetical protein VF649_06515 [Sphingomonas sp.]|jgi:hypothetical protein|uniref:hypothetical protein n=1 Tax=Sphingomonas sp. TaxID=28214 RepID=UPI002EDBA0D4
MSYQFIAWDHVSPVVRAIHAQACRCPGCRHPGVLRGDPRERRVRAVMFTIATLIGGTLGYAITPQQIAAGVAGLFL